MNFVLNWTTYLIVLPMVFLAAVVDAVGGGGGLISLPAYTLAGLDYNMASGCNKFSACFATLAATLRFIKSGRINWAPALCAVAGSLPCAFLGTWVSSKLVSKEFMNIFMICAIPCVAVFMLLKKEHKGEARPVTRVTLLLCFLIGMAVGFYDGFFGPGTGTFLILLFNALTGMDLVSASATAKPVNLASNMTSLVTRIALGQVIYALVIPATACSMLGGLVGSKLALTKGAKFIRYIMLFVLALLIVKMITELF